MMFTDRADAGRQLGRRLAMLRDSRPGLLGDNPVVVGLPRGGVAVAAEVARALECPLDVVMVRKLGVPGQPELAMGAISEGGVRILNEEVIRRAGITREEFAAVEEQQQAELERRARLFRGSRPRVDLAGRTVIVVDDGIATGATAAAACEVVRAAGASRVILAAPVASADRLTAMERYADEIICLDTPEPFLAIGQFYRDFTQTSDEEVTALLREADVRCSAAERQAAPGREQPAGAGRSAPAGGPAGSRAGRRVREETGEMDVEIPLGPVRLPGLFSLPGRGARVDAEGHVEAWGQVETRGVVVFAHGSGSSRYSPRNRFVAQTLRAAGLGTLLFDLLTPDEEADRANVFDIELLAERLAGATAWLRGRAPRLAELPLGYFGASTGAAAALWAAAEPDARIAAVVSRGGRPDLASARLPQVHAPTLLIVGGLDEVVLELNDAARALLGAPSRLVVVPGATHLFSEPGALEKVAALARDWFVDHMTPVGAAPRS